MYLEIELKLRIAPEDIHLLLQHPLVSLPHAKLAGVEQLISRYFDTPDLALWQQGLSLRVRESAGRMIQTLKTAGERIGDLQHRHEWEQPISQVEPDIQAFKEVELVQKLSDILQENPLKELFYTDFQRTQWDLHGANQTKVELVLDEGFIKTATNQSPLHELELELKQGDAQQLYSFAEKLKERIPLNVEVRSKAERGYLLYNNNKLFA